MNSSFESIITPTLVRAVVPAADWREAVEVVGGLMHEDGACTADYVTAMKQGVIDFGPYMVVAPGVAMPHARPEAGVLRPGIAVATLETPVPFGHQANDPVRLVIGFAAVDKNAHLERIQQIVALLQDSERMEAVHAARTDEELYAALT